MRNTKILTTAALLMLVAAAGCMPDEYPMEPRFEVIPDEGPVGHLFVYNLIDGVTVNSVNVAGSFQDPVWNMTATPMDRAWLVTVDLPAGTHQYKYIFNGDQWAGDMCNESTWGHPDYNNYVDPNGTGCVDGGQDAEIEVEEAGPHTFLYIVPEGAPEITAVNVAGSFQGWSMTATPMRETFALWVDLEEGEYEYKFIFNGDQWAGNMCNDTNWGDPDNGFRVDANGQGCVAGGENARLTID